MEIFNIKSAHLSYHCLYDILSNTSNTPFVYIRHISGSEGCRSVQANLSNPKNVSRFQSHNSGITKLQKMKFYKPNFE